MAHSPHNPHQMLNLYQAKKKRKEKNYLSDCLYTPPLGPGEVKNTMSSIIHLSIVCRFTWIFLDVVGNGI